MTPRQDFPTSRSFAASHPRVEREVGQSPSEYFADLMGLPPRETPNDDRCWNFSRTKGLPCLKDKGHAGKCGQWNP